MQNVKCYIFENINYVDLTLYRYGYEDCSPVNYYAPIRRNHYLLYFILQGKGQYHLGNAQYSLKKGEAFLIPPNMSTVYSADSSYHWSCIWIEFDGLKALDYLKEAGLSSDSPIFYPALNHYSNELISELFHLLNQHNESPILIMGHLYLIFDLLIKSSKNRRNKKIGNLQEFYTQEAVHFIEQNYDKNVTVEDMAVWCNLNRSYFSKIFKQTLSVPPQKFLLQYRMRKACNLLSNTNSSIGEIALSVGYPNQLHFSRAFKNIYGVSPRTYRLIHKISMINEF